MICDVSLRLVYVGPVAVPAPKYQSPGAAGIDLHAALREPITLEPLGRALVPTGIALAIPDGYEGQVRPRSGLAAKLGLTVLNAPGTIDSDYRGEIKVLLVNLSREPATIAPLDRVAQLVISEVCRAELYEVPELDATSRGDGGYGSTGR